MAMSLQCRLASSGASFSTPSSDSPNDFWRQMWPEVGGLALEDDALALVVVVSHGEDGEGHLGRLRLASVTAGVGGDRSRLGACHSPANRPTVVNLFPRTGHSSIVPFLGSSRDQTRPRRVA